ncbi:MAG: AAA family ATPase, partial [Steroidobacteraceae bacterium]
FMMRIDLTYPSLEDEAAVLRRYGTLAALAALAALAPAGASPSDPPARPDEGAHAGPPAAAVSFGPPAHDAAVSPEDLAAARDWIDRIHVAPQLVDYVLRLATASREHAQIALGLSTRGALALLHAARAVAALRGSEFVTPDDVKAVVPWVIPHRLTLTAGAVLEGTSDRVLAQSLLERVPVPR